MLLSPRSNAAVGYDPREGEPLSSGEGAPSAAEFAYQYWMEKQTLLKQSETLLRPKPGIIEAEEILDLKVDLDMSLGSSQKALVKAMEHAILEGNADSLLTICRGFARDPEGMKAIVERCRRDLEPALTAVTFFERYLQSDSGASSGTSGNSSHLIAILTLMEKRGGTAVLITNCNDLGLGVAGPYVPVGDGNYRLSPDSGPDDPQRVLAAIGRRAAEQIVLLNG